MIFFVDPYHKQVYQMSLSSSSTPQGMPLPRMDYPVSMDVDRSTGKLFWIDGKKILSSGFKKTDTPTLVHELMIGMNCTLSN